MKGFISHIISEKSKDKRVENIVSTLKVLKYGDMLIIKVLDDLGKTPKISDKQLQSALKKAKVKDKDISVVVAAMNEETK